jgi:gamma-glutamyltranspeptidase/glutathione hydrolase
MHPSHVVRTSRRQFLELAAAGVLTLRSGVGRANDESAATGGLVIGQSEGATAAAAVLADGGNAVDAVVAAALVAGVVAVSRCGIGGYGGHMVVGVGEKVTAIDFNSTAPAAAREDMFLLDPQGRVRGSVNHHGWLAAGVPGTLAGLQLAIDQFGTCPLSQLIEPAIRAARDGFTISAPLARAIAASAPQFQRDAGSKKLFFADGKPLAEGATLRNPDLAAMLAELAKANSVDSFYRGPIARAIAGEFQKHGGLVTERDLAAYEARIVEPVSLTWRGSTISTAPLTAGGATVLEALAALRALGWESLDPADPKTTHARIEALRLAWKDRLKFMGDPDGGPVPVARLLSESYAAQSAEQIRQAVDHQRLISASTDGRPAGGTVHLSACDRSGMMAALTMTHGDGFGARVTVEGLGLILGHGMSRFEPRPGYPNSIRPGLRPLDNMCPTVVVRDGRPIVAMGATGGRRIPNTLFDVLVNLVGRGHSLVESAAAPRVHTEGGDKLQMAPGWSARDREYLVQVGYTVQPGGGAEFNGLARDGTTGTLTSVS